MSIALTAVVRPSRLLRTSLATYGTANLAAAFVLAWGLAGRFVLPYLLAAACLSAALACLRAYRCTKTTRRIDISGVGEIHLTVQQSGGLPVEQRVQVHLMPGSTLWPQLLLLLLRHERGQVTVLTVLPDSVAPAQFRALAVALRVIAGRDNKFFGVNKIL